MCVSFMDEMRKVKTRENEPDKKTKRDKDRETERKREGEMGVASEVKRRCQGPEARKYAVS